MKLSFGFWAIRARCVDGLEVGLYPIPPLDLFNLSLPKILVPEAVKVKYSKMLC